MTKKGGGGWMTLVLFTGENRIEMDENACGYTAVNVSGDAAFIRLWLQGGDCQSQHPETSTTKSNRNLWTIGLFLGLFKTSLNNFVFVFASVGVAETQQDAPWQSRQVLVPVVSAHSGAETGSKSTDVLILKFVKQNKTSHKPSVEEQKMFHRVYSLSEFSAGQIVASTKGAEKVIRVNSATRHLSSEFGRCTPGTGHRVCNYNFPVTLRHLGSALLLKRYLNLQGNASNTIYNIRKYVLWHSDIEAMSWL